MGFWYNFLGGVDREVKDKLSLIWFRKIDKKFFIFIKNKWVKVMDIFVCLVVFVW